MKQANHLVFYFSPRSLWSIAIAADTAPPTLLSIERYSANNLELERGILFNPSKIKPFISATLKKCKDPEIPTFFIISGPCLQEKFVTLPHMHPQLNELSISFSPHKHIEYCYVYPYESEHVFYVCSLDKAIILQYTLLAQECTVNLQGIIPAHMALLHVYKNMYGPTYRNTQLGLDMMRKNNQIDRLFKKEDVARILATHTITLHPTDYIPILAACGTLHTRP